MNAPYSPLERYTPLSKRQRSLLGAVAEFWARRGYSPTCRDMLDAGVSTSSSVVDYNLRVLAKAGLLRSDRGVARSIVLTDDGWALSGVERPCCGSHG